MTLTEISGQRGDAAPTALRAAGGAETLSHPPAGEGHGPAHPDPDAPAAAVPGAGAADGALLRKELLPG